MSHNLKTKEAIASRYARIVSYLSTMVLGSAGGLLVAMTNKRYCDISACRAETRANEDIGTRWRTSSQINSKYCSATVILYCCGAWNYMKKAFFFLRRCMLQARRIHKFPQDSEDDLCSRQRVLARIGWEGKTRERKRWRDEHEKFRK